MTSTPLSPSLDTLSRVRTGGKYLRRGAAKWWLNGVSYGPFKPNELGEPFPERVRLATDFAVIRGMGFNALRIYELPTAAVLEEAAAHDLLLLVGIPWTEHVDFLRSPDHLLEIEKRVRTAALSFGSHPSVAALVIGNEIEKTLVRWMGPVKVKRFLEQLIDRAREAAPECLLTYATYPSTEYLIPANADFVAVNVYLEDEATFVSYLRRLQNLACNRPLVILEFGVDALRNGDEKQAQIRRWEMLAVLREGTAGNVWFAFTDEWFRGGQEVSDWGFGLVTADRQPRIASEVVIENEPPLAGPRISVVVCTRNGSATLRECLKALEYQSYGNYEVIVIDDGSTDEVPAIAQDFPDVRYQRQEHAGLSVARNLGAQLATGEIIAYTDDDCMADEDWLRYIARAFDDPQWVAAGGPNIPPQARNRIEAVVAAAPGGPSHVLLNDVDAEHLPGCNIAIRKASLDAIGGFQAPFMTAGDDVDVCWRLREAGGKLRFVPGAMVWHHRRFSVRAYLRQQSGYGKAEALLMKHHPRRFGALGGARWRGLIYGDATGSLPPTEGSIFHGPFGTGLFQVIYTSSNAFCWFDVFSGLSWIAVALVLALVGLPVAALSVCCIAAYYAWRRMADGKAAKIQDKALLWFLCLVQPVVREWARLKGMIRLGARPGIKAFRPNILPPRKPAKRSHKVLELAFWSEAGVGRDDWMHQFREVLMEEHLTAREDDGWRWFDFELLGIVGLSCVTEYHGGQKQLTRVSLSRRSDRLLWPTAVVGSLIIWGVAPVIYHWFGGVGDPKLLLPFYAVLFARPLFELLFFWPMAKSKVRDMALRAAERAGLKEI
ncbi:MAG: putative glycosyltransferase [Verrucomicrobiaceae bacterium]|nr:putative glycosyltransferase [Verrucomicrobiaceae bacterium]